MTFVLSRTPVLGVSDRDAVANADRRTK